MPSRMPLLSSDHINCFRQCPGSTTGRLCLTRFSAEDGAVVKANFSRCVTQMGSVDHCLTRFSAEDGEVVKADFSRCVTHTGSVDH